MPDPLQNVVGWWREPQDAVMLDEAPRVGPQDAVMPGPPRHEDVLAALNRNGKFFQFFD